MKDSDMVKELPGRTGVSAEQNALDELNANFKNIEDLPTTNGNNKMTDEEAMKKIFDARRPVKKVTTRSAKDKAKAKAKKKSRKRNR